jgi:hypothetical protein
VKIEIGRKSRNLEIRIGKWERGKFGNQGVVFEGGGDGGQEVEVGELFVDAVFGSGGFDAEEVAFWELKGALLDCGVAVRRASYWVSVSSDAYYLLNKTASRRRQVSFSSSGWRRP